MSVPNVVVWIMVILVSLVAGFLIGWVSEYYIDLKHWKKRAEMQGLAFLGTQEGPAATAMVTPAVTEHPDADARANAQLAATLQEFLEKLGAEVKCIHCALTQGFPRNPEPVAANLTALREEVVKEGADVLCPGCRCRSAGCGG